MSSSMTDIHLDVIWDQPSPSPDKGCALADGASFGAQPNKKQEWKSVVDSSSGKIYYYHSATRETRWVKPEGYEEELSADEKKRSPTKEGIWKSASDKQGRTYYYHTGKREISWEKPEEFDGEEPSSEVRNLPEKKTCGRWKSVVDSSSGTVYYYHSATKETRWVKPEGFDGQELSGDEKKKSPTKEGVWKSASDKAGRTYYYHTGRKEVSWVKPGGSYCRIPVPEKEADRRFCHRRSSLTEGNETSATEYQRQDQAEPPKAPHPDDDLSQLTNSTASSDDGETAATGLTLCRALPILWPTCNGDITAGVLAVRGTCSEKVDGIYKCTGTLDCVGMYCKEEMYNGNQVTFTIYRKQLPDMTRRWYLSIGPSVGKRTRLDIDMYSAPAATCGPAACFVDELPPQNNWEPLGGSGLEGTNAPTCVWIPSSRDLENTFNDQAGLDRDLGCYVATDHPLSGIFVQAKRPSGASGKFQTPSTSHSSISSSSCCSSPFMNNEDCPSTSQSTKPLVGLDATEARVASVQAKLSKVRRRLEVFREADERKQAYPGPHGVRDLMTFWEQTLERSASSDTMPTSSVNANSDEGAKDCPSSGMQKTVGTESTSSNSSVEFAAMNFESAGREVDTNQSPNPNHVRDLKTFWEQTVEKSISFDMTLTSSLSSVYANSDEVAKDSPSSGRSETVGTESTSFSSSVKSATLAEEGHEKIVESACTQEEPLEKSPEAEPKPTVDKPFETHGEGDESEADHNSALIREWTESASTKNNKADISRQWMTKHIKNEAAFNKATFNKLLDGWKSRVKDRIGRAREGKDGLGAIDSMAIDKAELHGGITTAGLEEKEPDTSGNGNAGYNGSILREWNGNGHKHENRDQHMTLNKVGTVLSDFNKTCKRVDDCLQKCNSPSRDEQKTDIMLQWRDKCNDNHEAVVDKAKIVEDGKLVEDRNSRTWAKPDQTRLYSKDKVSKEGVIDDETMDKAKFHEEITEARKEGKEWPGTPDNGSASDKGRILRGRRGNRKQHVTLDIGVVLRDFGDMSKGEDHCFQKCSASSDEQSSVEVYSRYEI